MRKILRSKFFIAAFIGLILATTAICAALDHNPGEEFCIFVEPSQMQPWTLYWSPYHEPCIIKWDIVLKLFGGIFAMVFFPAYAFLWIAAFTIKIFKNL